MGYWAHPASWMTHPGRRHHDRGLSKYNVGLLGASCQGRKPRRPMLSIAPRRLHRFAINAKYVVEQFPVERLFFRYSKIDNFWNRHVKRPTILRRENSKDI